MVIAVKKPKYFICAFNESTFARPLKGMIPLCL